jgi:hypothetical protein
LILEVNAGLGQIFPLGGSGSIARVIQVPEQH